MSQLDWNYYYALAISHGFSQNLAERYADKKMAEQKQC